MNAPHTPRRLAAILIADVAGYSRLMEQDERGTHARTTEILSKVVQPSIIGNGGRLLKTMGDGVLASFASATDAVRCAIEIQRQGVVRNVGIPKSEQINFRIGINVADVLFAEDDVAGGGVNLAARLQTLATPGGICITESVREQVQENLGVTFLPAGTRRVKNINKPVKVLRVLLEPPRLQERLRLAADRVSARFVVAGLAVVVALAVVAVLALRAPPADSELEKLSLQVGNFGPAEPNDGDAARVGKLISQRIYLALSPEHHVLKIKGTKPGEDERGSPVARYVIEGVVASGKEGYRVDARLLNSRTRDTLWGDGFELKNASIATVEAGARRVSHAVYWHVFQQEVERIKASPPRRPDSMDFVLMGYAALNDQRTKESKRLFERALEVDAKSVPGLLGVAYLSSDAEMDQLTQKAVTTDPMCADSWVARAEILSRQGQSKAAREAVDRSLQINPANMSALYERDRQLMSEGRWDAVIRPLDEIEFEFAKSPYLAGMLGAQCRARLLAEQSADHACDKWYVTSGKKISLAFATAAAARNGSIEEVANAGARLKARYPDLTIVALRQESASDLYSDQYRQRLEAVVYPLLRKAGIPEK